MTLSSSGVETEAGPWWVCYAVPHPELTPELRGAFLSACREIIGDSERLVVADPYTGRTAEFESLAPRLWRWALGIDSRVTRDVDEITAREYDRARRIGRWTLHLWDAAATEPRGLHMGAPGVGAWLWTWKLARPFRSEPWRVVTVE